MGVCCIVFDIDGMLFEFFMNFLNIEKNTILRFCFPIFHVFFTFHAISNIKQNIFGVKKKNPLNWRWFLQIVERDSWNLYPLYPLFPCSDFVSQMWGWFGGGRCNVFLTFYAISNISRKKNLGIQTNYFSLNVFVFFFCILEILKSVPFTYSYWLNGRWFLQIVDIGNFIIRLEILKIAPSLTATG